MDEIKKTGLNIFEMKIFGIISMGLFAGCFLPQIRLTFKTKNVSGISPGLWIMVVAGYLTGLIYTVDVGDVVLILTYSIGLILSATVLFGYYRYR